MSLLMDALKRAERAREAKDGSGALGDDGAQSAIPELRLDPIETVQGQEIDNSLTNAGFSLEPIGEGGGDDGGPQPLGAPGVTETGIDLFKLDDDPPLPSAAAPSSQRPVN